MTAVFCKATFYPFDPLYWYIQLLKLRCRTLHSPLFNFLMFPSHLFLTDLHANILIALQFCNTHKPVETVFHPPVQAISEDIKQHHHPPSICEENL